MKNLVVYKINQEFQSEAIWEVDFHNKQFLPCNTLSSKSIGFTHNVFNSYVESLSGGIVLLNITTQKKSPKKYHIQKLVENRVDSIFNLTGNKPSKSEMQSIEDDAYSEVIKVTYPDEPVNVKVFFNPLTGLLFIECNSYKKSEEILSYLKEVIGDTLKTTLPEVEDVDTYFTKYLLGGIGDPFTLGTSAKLITPEGRKLTLSKDDMLSLSGGLVKSEQAMVEELSVEYDGVMEFKIKPSLEITSIKFNKEALSDVKEDNEGTELLQVKELSKMYSKLSHMLEET